MQYGAMPPDRPQKLSGDKRLTPAESMDSLRGLHVNPGRKQDSHRQTRALAQDQFVLPTLCGAWNLEPPRTCSGNDRKWSSIFAFDLILRLHFSEGFGAIEHPDEPEEDFKPSIWKLPILTIFRALPGFAELRFAQGLLGASSPKLTRLLSLNLPGLQRTLRAHHITKDLPRRLSIGKLNGVWSTGFLKEYPPAMSRALAVEFMAWFGRQCTDVQLAENHAFLARCKLMSATALTDQIGADYTSK